VNDYLKNEDEGEPRHDDEPVLGVQVVVGPRATYTLQNKERILEEQKTNVVSCIPPVLKNSKR
jgi:hypothetical protein